MIKKFLQFLRNDELTDRIDAVIQQNIDFVLSLTPRQLDYYASLNDSWRKELTKLEQRIYELEGKSNVL